MNNNVHETVHASCREASIQKNQRWKTIGTSDVFIKKQKSFTFKTCAIQNHNRPYSFQHVSAGLVSNCFINGTHSLRIEILRMIMVRSKLERAKIPNTATEEQYRRNETTNLQAMLEPNTKFSEMKKRSIGLQELTISQHISDTTTTTTKNNNHSTTSARNEPHKRCGCARKMHTVTQRVQIKIKKRRCAF